MEKIMKYRIQVNTYGDRNENTWTGNAVTYASQAQAEYAAENLFMRWTGVKHYRVVDQNDTVVFRSDTWAP